MLRLAHYIPKGKGEKKRFYGYMQAGKCKYVVTTWMYCSTLVTPKSGGKEPCLQMLPIDPKNPDAVYALDA